MKNSTVITKGNWRKIEKNSKNIGDKLGKGIDDKIFLPVVALRTYGFDTTASCEGHLNWGEPFPWIDIGVITRPPKAQKLERSIRVNNLKEQKRLLKLLEEFYTQRAVNIYTRLILAPVGIFGGFQLTNQAGEIQATFPIKERKRNLADFQKEFKDFAIFLKNKLA
jgi:hypothetical protein